MPDVRFLNTILLGGSPADKLEAAQAAGFDSVELWRQDVDAFDARDASTGFDDKAAGLAGKLRALELGLVDYQVLLDFDGAPAEQQAAKRAEAVTMMDAAVKLGADTLLVPASTAADCDPDRVVDDLRWLADEAASRQLRIAYEAMAWSTFHAEVRSAWAVVRELKRPNVGLVIDAFHVFSIGGTVADLAGIPADRILLVQLSDLAQDLSGTTRQALIDIARHQRLLPGEGDFPLTSLREWARAIGYRGPVGLEVFNDRWKSRPPQDAAIAAMQALRAAWPD